MHLDCPNRAYGLFRLSKLWTFVHMVRFAPEACPDCSKCLRTVKADHNLRYSLFSHRLPFLGAVVCNRFFKMVVSVTLSPIMIARRCRRRQTPDRGFHPTCYQPRHPSARRHGASSAFSTTMTLSADCSSNPSLDSPVFSLRCCPNVIHHIRHKCKPASHRYHQRPRPSISRTNAVLTRSNDRPLR